MLISIPPTNKMMSPHAIIRFSSVKTYRKLNLRLVRLIISPFEPSRRLILTSNKNIYHRIKCPRNHPLGGLLSCPHSDSVFRFCFKLIWVFSSPILPELQIQFDVEIGKFIKIKKRAISSQRIWFLFRASDWLIMICFNYFIQFCIGFYDLGSEIFGPWLIDVLSRWIKYQKLVS